MYPHPVEVNTKEVVPTSYLIPGEMAAVRRNVVASISDYVTVEILADSHFVGISPLPVLRSFLRQYIGGEYQRAETNKRAVTDAFMDETVAMRHFSYSQGTYVRWLMTKVSVSLP